MRFNALTGLRNTFNTVSKHTKIMMSHFPMTTFCTAMMSVPLLAGVGTIPFAAIFPFGMSLLADIGFNGPALKDYRETLRNPEPSRAVS